MSVSHFTTVDHIARAEIYSVLSPVSFPVHFPSPCPFPSPSSCPSPFSLPLPFHFPFPLRNSNLASKETRTAWSIPRPQKDIRQSSFLNGRNYVFVLDLDQLPMLSPSLLPPSPQMLFTQTLKGQFFQMIAPHTNIDGSFVDVVRRVFYLGKGRDKVLTMFHI